MDFPVGLPHVSAANDSASLFRGFPCIFLVSYIFSRIICSISFLIYVRYMTGTQAARKQLLLLSLHRVVQLYRQRLIEDGKGLCPLHHKSVIQSLFYFRYTHGS